MKHIELTGLRADLPIGAMAAFGCLRICQGTEAFRGAKLGWERAGGSFAAVLSTEEARTPGELVACLMEDVKRAPLRTELTWRARLKKLPPEEYRRAAADAARENAEAAAWFAAFGSEAVPDSDGDIEPTPLDMTGGPQEFLAGARELAQRLSTEPEGKKGKTPERAFREALFGPWEYTDDQHSLGWDPATIKLGAFTYRAPTKMENAGVMAAVWLAFESLPLFPCFSGGVRGFQHTRREWTFYWPVWKAPLSVQALEYFLTLTEEDMARRGACAVYRSRRFRLNKYYAAFRTPELAWGEALEAEA